MTTGTFRSTIANSSTTHSALQQLETAVEARARNTTVSEIDANADGQSLWFR